MGKIRGLLFGSFSSVYIFNTLVLADGKIIVYFDYYGIFGSYKSRSSLFL